MDDRPLLDALRAKTIAGAALDVFVAESDPACKAAAQELITMPNVVAHAAASTREGLNRTNMIAAQSVVAVLEGRDPPADCVVADGRTQ